MEQGERRGWAGMEHGKDTATPPGIAGTGHSTGNQTRNAEPRGAASRTRCQLRGGDGTGSPGGASGRDAPEGRRNKG